jgi:hypothetical protein
MLGFGQSIQVGCIPFEVVGGKGSKVTRPNEIDLAAFGRRQQSSWCPSHGMLQSTDLHLICQVIYNFFVFLSDVLSGAGGWSAGILGAHLARDDDIRDASSPAAYFYEIFFN